MKGVLERTHAQFQLSGSELNILVEVKYRVTPSLQNDSFVFCRNFKPSFVCFDNDSAKNRKVQ